jgi:hypothetical protein
MISAVDPPLPLGVIARDLLANLLGDPFEALR